MEFAIKNNKKYTMKECIKPNINPAFLWEYDLATFNWEKSYKIVIERILERGNFLEWKEMVKFYTKDQILETIKWSAQLEQRDKDFSLLFLQSDYLNAA